MRISDWSSDVCSSDLFANEGTRVLFDVAWPGQGFYTKFPVETVEDFKDKKLRIYSAATQKMGEMLGFNATILPFAEVPQSFSTGLIEAMCNSQKTGIDIQARDQPRHLTYARPLIIKTEVIRTDKHRVEK